MIQSYALTILVGFSKKLVLNMVVVIPKGPIPASNFLSRGAFPLFYHLKICLLHSLPCFSPSTAKRMGKKEQTPFPPPSAIYLRLRLPLGVATESLFRSSRHVDDDGIFYFDQDVGSDGAGFLCAHDGLVESVRLVGVEAA